MSLDQSYVGDLDLTLGFTGARVVIGVRGDLDRLTAPDLTAVVTAVLDRGHTTIVVDLSELTFIDGAGMQVLVGASFRLQPVDGVVILRSVRPGTRHVLDVTGVSALVRYESGDPGDPADPADGGVLLAVGGSVSLGPEQRSGDHSGVVASDAPHRSADPGRFIAIPANDDLVDAALRLVVALAQATVDGAEGVSVSLSRHGLIETVASTDETITQMDHDQYATGQGPCLAAAAEGHWFHVARLAEETRWPAFIPRAIEGGIASILSTPLLVADRPVGALNMYSSAERAFGPAAQELAALFATQASVVLSEARIDISGGDTGQRLQDALLSRQVIAQAQGVTMERLGVSADQASATLRRTARQAGQPVRQAAVDLLTSTVREEGPRG